jgi:2-polyprenyl-6-methoxyphenol hydroxylase-like FAD-dependent oxidoreductase
MTEWVACSGAGPAGLALASTLIQDEASTHEITIYEATASFREVGVGVTISGRAFAIARAIGMEEALNQLDQEKDKPKTGAQESCTYIVYHTFLRSTQILVSWFGVQVAAKDMLSLK